MSQFVHLHVHTQYSILDGAASISSLMKMAQKYEMPAIAITDHGNMFGVKDFFDASKHSGVKPILGCEAYCVDDLTVKRKETEKRYHLILLAKNYTGYHNLIRLISLGYTEGFYGRPRIDKKNLEAMHEGIICCSACIGGEVPKAILRGDMAEAERVTEWFKGVFGEDYYLEMQLHKPSDPTRVNDVYPKQVTVNRALRQLSEKYAIKLICTNDVHFTHQDDAVAHDHLICLNTGRDLDDPTRMRYTGEEYFKSPEQMAELFADCPEALTNTLEIADKVERYELDNAPLMPNFEIPEDFDIDPEELRKGFLRKNDDNRKKVDTDIKKLKRDDENYEAKRLKFDDKCAKLDDEKVLIEQAASMEILVGAHPEFKDLLTVTKQFQYLKHLATEGCKVRYGDPLPENVQSRLDYELRTIEWMGFPGYFLIVWDYIRAAREMGVSVGPGRGSAAGSVVAYALKITNIDPIKYDLLFERFLNPDRISLPDVDVDFDEDGRADVLNYVVNKYGRKRVAQIVTFGSMAPKMAIKDVARVQKLPLSESDRLTKLVPDKIDNDKKHGETPFDWLYKNVPDLAKEKESANQTIQTTLKYAEQLEGSIRQTGVHACGVIIGQDDLEKFAPVAIAKDAELNVVQFDGRFVESVGLIKMDFLGLKTLSIIKDALSNVKRTRAVDIDIDNVPLDDKLTYELFSHGDTTGIFQFESPGMKKYLRALQPNRLEDLIAMNALYRPGPMDKIPNFVARKMGKEEVTYEFPEMEKYLSDTYGITVYQEQVMLLSQLLAGFTGGEADTLRKAMGKKKRDVLDKMKPQFINGAVERGHDAATCEKIWGEWEAFASYAFNKSHSTCYAFVAYQTAYLKAHYPSEFMAALLSRNLSNIDKLTNFMDECKRMGIRVLGPDVNESIHTFTADRDGNVRFGMAGVKGVGEGAVKSMVQEREQNGPFKDVYDFVERIDFQSVNRKCIENMALAGAFDSISGFDRSKFFAADLRDPNSQPFLDQLMRYGSKFQNEKNNMQQSLFGGDEHEDIQKPLVPACKDWTKLETLTKEREMIGIYLSSHPLDDYSIIVKHLCKTQLAELANLNDLAGKEISFAGMVTAVANLYTKNGKPYGRFTLEDYSGAHEFVLFDKDYENFRKFMFTDYFLFVRATIKPKPYNQNELEIKISSMMQLDEAQQTMIREIVLNIGVQDISKELIRNLSETIGASKGNTSLKVRVSEPQSGISVGMFSKGHRVNVDKHFIDFCDNNQINYTLL